MEAPRGAIDRAEQPDNYVDSDVNEGSILLYEASKFAIGVGALIATVGFALEKPVIAAIGVLIAVAGVIELYNSHFDIEHPDFNPHEVSYISRHKLK